MSLLLENNKEATELMLSMRTLINLEFKVLLNFTHDEVEKELCAYGLKSQSPDLLTKARQLAKIANITLPDRQNGVNSILELLISDQLQKPSQIIATGVPAFVIDKRSNKCWSASTLRRLIKLGEVDVSHIEIRPLSDGEMRDLVDYLGLSQTSTKEIIPMNSFPLEEFFWFASTSFSHGRLLQGLSLIKQVRLTRWPEICRQREYRVYTRMAVQLMQHPASVSEFIRVQGRASEPGVITFLNACYLCGWLIETQEPLQVKQDNPNKKTKLNFISRIRAKLGIGKA